MLTKLQTLGWVYIALMDLNYDYNYQCSSRYVALDWFKFQPIPWSKDRLFDLIVKISIMKCSVSEELLVLKVPDYSLYQSKVRHNV